MAYYFNASAGVVETVYIRKTQIIDVACGLIGCSHIEFYMSPDSYTVLFDENGLRRGLLKVAEIEGFRTPLGGNLIITGVDNDGELSWPKLSLFDFAKKVTIIRPVLDPVVSRDLNGVVATSFKIRIVRQKPKIVDSTETSFKLTCQ